MSALLASLLIWGAATDLRKRIIANELNLAIALLAPLWWWVSGLSLWPDVALQIGFAVIIFGIFAALFAMGMMGGGDVKLLGALALWLPWQAMMTLLLVMAVVGGAVTAITLVHHKMSRRIGPPEVPYGVAIALAGLWVLGERYLNPFIQ